MTDPARSGGGYSRATRAEQARVNAIPLAWPLGTPPPSGPGAFPIQLVDTFWGPRNHAGLDIGARRGTPIVASVSGEIVVARTRDEEGNYVAIRDAHGWLHYSMHMLRPALVTPGAAVFAGITELGAVGDTGRADGFHLHYAIILPNRHAANPYRALRAALEIERPPGVFT